MWKNIAAVQATDDNIIWRMRIAYWMTKATYTQTQVVENSLHLHYNNGCTNAPKRYVIRTLPVLFT